jgi:hypothetical protein
MCYIVYDIPPYEPTLTKPVLKLVFEEDSIMDVEYKYNLDLYRQEFFSIEIVLDTIYTIESLNYITYNLRLLSVPLLKNYPDFKTCTVNKPFKIKWDSTHTKEERYHQRIQNYKLYNDKLDLDYKTRLELYENTRNSLHYMWLGYLNQTMDPIKVTFIFNKLPDYLQKPKHIHY